jgi:hypothetical protein
MKKYTQITEGKSIDLLQGKTYKATRTTNSDVPTVEDIPTMTKDYRANVVAWNEVNLDKKTMHMTQNDESWTVGANWIRKPTLTRKDKGTITFGSNGTYRYTDSDENVYHDGTISDSDIKGNTVTTFNMSFKLGKETEWESTFDRMFSNNN